MMSSLRKWIKQQNEIVLERQRNSSDPQLRQMVTKFRAPYYGAIGGAITTYYKIGSKDAYYKHNVTNNEFHFQQDEITNIPENAQSFIEQHKDSELFISYTNTSLGQICTIHDFISGNEECLTDFNEW